MDISVVIPVRNRVQNINLVLAALTKQTYKNFEVIISDDNSTDEASSLVEGWRSHFSLRYLFNNIRYGSWNASRPRNLGAWIASPDNRAFLFLDSDVVLPPTALEHYKEDLDHNSNRVVIGGYHWLKHNNFSQQDILVQTDHRAFFESIVEAHDMRMPSFEKASTPDDVFTAVFDGLACFGGNLLIPRSIFFKVGGFDETILKGCEDGDMGLSLWSLAKSGIIAGFSYDRRTCGYHLKHPVPADRTDNSDGGIPEQVKKLNLKHFGTENPDFGLIEASKEAYRQWGVNWEPPEEWKERVK